MGERVQAFGGGHTRRKLDVVAKYLAAYVTVMKKQDFRLHYVDGFAGSGASTSKSESQKSDDPTLFSTADVIDGSPVRALEVEPPFDRYLLIDKSDDNVRSLVGLRAQFWGVMEACPQHHFQVLTKRPERMERLFRDGALKNLLHVWLGTSVENAEVAERIRSLSAIADATLFVSFEPLIGRIEDVDLRKIHWAIVGGESGPRARAMEEEWVERLYDICRRDDVAFFFKQWGGKNKKVTGREFRGRTYDEYPLELEP